MSDLQDKLDYADDVADWFLDMAEAGYLLGNPEVGVRCDCTAANILCKQNRTLASGRIEDHLLMAARRIPDDGPHGAVAARDNNGYAYLHVLSEALPVGGITSFVLRWMRGERRGRTHHLALLSQRMPVPEELRTAVIRTGGNIHVAGGGDPMLGKAAWLRKLAREIATVVVLHIDISDVICGAAFGVPGGPPVILINYNAHVFWTGASIADLVVNIRGSALEEYWTTVYRGVARCATIPIPLPEPQPIEDAAGRAVRQTAARTDLGIAQDAAVIMTTGASFKYLPVNGLDFLDTCGRLLEQVPGAVVLAAGFNADDRWQQAAERSGGRIRALGTLSQERLSVLHDAADVYIEGFPFGTTTSLLEAGLKGIPAVLAPVQCPPPYGSDGVALDDVLERPVSVEDYIRQIRLLCVDAGERRRQGDALRASVAAHHTGTGWDRHLEEALGQLQGTHAPRKHIKPVRTPEPVHEYWSTFVEEWNSRYEESLESAVDTALSLGVRPRLTWNMARSCERHASLRSRRTVPRSLISVLFAYVLPLMPAAWGRSVFRLCSFIWRASLLSRLWNRVARLSGGAPRQGTWYGEYRRMSGAQGRAERVS